MCTLQRYAYAARNSQDAQQDALHGPNRTRPSQTKPNRAICRRFRPFTWCRLPATQLVFVVACAEAEDVSDPVALVLWRSFFCKSCSLDFFVCDKANFVLQLLLNRGQVLKRSDVVVSNSFRITHRVRHRMSRVQKSCTFGMCSALRKLFQAKVCRTGLQVRS